MIASCVALGAAALALSGCGGSDASPAASPVEASTSPSPTAYSLDDRETFLATGPDCDTFQGWYQQFPADKDGLTALRYIEACNEAPAPVLNDDIYAGSNDRMLEALLAPAVTGPSRAAAHDAIAQGVCSMFDDGSKSLWLVADTVRDYGGTTEDYRAVVASAVDQCASNADDLKLFTTDDVLGATDSLTKALRDVGADLSSFSSAGGGSGGQVSALAAVACQSARDGDGADNGFFVSTLLDISEADGNQISAQALDLFCPNLA